jgi:SAM-dependent methyltransferase
MARSFADAWEGADQYEAYVGRWSRPVARDFISWLGVPVGSRWLDVGCGTGALSETILERAEPLQVVAIDPSQRFVDDVASRILDGRAAFRVGDAQELPVDLGDFDAVVSGLVLNFIPDLDRAMSQMTGATRVGGTVAGYVWDYAGQMEFLRHFWDAAVELSPDARELDEGRRFPICRPGPLGDLFARHLSDVSVVDLVVPTVFDSFDDYWVPFLGGQGPAPGYVMSLGDADRDRLRENLRSRLAIGQDGSIALRARAWAVRGRRT